VDPALYQLIEPVVVLGTLLGLSFGVKYLIWGKGPIRRRKQISDDDLTARVADIEQQVRRRFAEFAELHGSRIADLEERLDFAERLLTKQRLEEPLGLPDAGKPADD
jgi:hypothetical protein